MSMSHARRRALEVLAAGPARYSNVTDGENTPMPTLYHQTADYLLDVGLAIRDEEDSAIIWVTDAGRAALLAATGRLSIVRDEDCPECGWPETYVEGPETGPDVQGCRKCGWRTKLAISEPEPNGGTRP